MPTVVITGATRGIGRELAQLYLAEGATVVVGNRTPSAHLVALGAEEWPLDVASGASVAKSRASTFSATGYPWPESVVRTRKRRRVTERIPAWRMYLATVLTQTPTPEALSSACTRGLP